MGSLSGILLGLINVAIVLVILVMVGAIIVWVANMLGWPIPWNIQQLYLAVVALIGLYMIVALLFGLTTIRVIGGRHADGPMLGGVVSAPQSIIR